MRTIGNLIQIAKDHHWRVNPNPKIVEMILTKENQSFAKLNAYYCPCKLQKIASNICPCQSAQAEIDAEGHCHCNLFFKEG
jgi:ferredoxin-thioredoxin reductase catalytic chain